ncbi:MAG: FAD binding domain-containing protein [Pirellulales bacterium]
MKAIDYAAPQTLEQAVALLAEGNGRSRVLCGGTDVIVQVREGRRDLDLLVDVKKIPEVNALAYDAKQGLVLGAAVPCAAICEDRAVAPAYPGLIDAVSLVGGAQIQSRASVGGNLCNGSPAADTVPPLIALGATCRIVGPGGKERMLPVEQFCTGPGQTVLKPGELLVSFHLPPPAKNSGCHYLRFIPRNEMDIAVVGAAASVVLDGAGTTFQTGRVALAAVAPTPLLVTEATDLLSGSPVSEQTIGRVAEAAQSAARPITDMRGTAEFRRHLSAVLTRRALAGALQRARGESPP